MYLKCNNVILKAFVKAHISLVQQVVNSLRHLELHIRLDPRLVTLPQYNIVLRFTVNNKEVHSYLYIPGLNQPREFSHICKSPTWIKNGRELAQARETPPIKIEKNPHVGFRLRAMFCTVAAS